MKYRSEKVKLVEAEFDIAKFPYIGRDVPMYTVVASFETLLVTVKENVVPTAT